MNAPKRIYKLCCAWILLDNQNSKTFALSTLKNPNSNPKKVLADTRDIAEWLGCAAWESSQFSSSYFPQANRAREHLERLLFME